MSQRTKSTPHREGLFVVSRFMNNPTAAPEGDVNQVPGHFMYVVLCEFDDEAIRRAFEKWLLAGHLAEVSTFALTAMLVRIDFSRAERPALEVHYTFRDRSEYERYLKEAAPRLRADSQERFPAGVRWQRRTGAVIHRLARSDS